MRARRGSALPLLAGAVLLIGTAACGDDGDDGGGDLGSVETDGSSNGGTDDGEAASIGEVQTFDVVEIEGCEPGDDGTAHCAHVNRELDYDHVPPVGGPHTDAFQDCLFYEDPVYVEGAVHALEHGAVWIVYSPDLPAEQIDVIESMAAPDKVLASPWDDADGELPAPVVLSAWGAQLLVESLPDEAADRFIAEYMGNRQNAPEPGAPCQGSYDQPR